MNETKDLDFLHVRYSLVEDKRFQSMVVQLKIDPDLLLGKLIRFWIYVSEHSGHGYIAKALSDDIDDIIDQPGFCHAMVAVKWLMMTREGVHVTHWDDYLSPLAKRMAVDSYREKAKNHREHLTRTFRAERREQSQQALFHGLTPTPVPHAKQYPVYGGFEDWWAWYPRKQGKQQAERIWHTKVKPDPEFVKVLIAALQRQRDWPDWKKEGGMYIPHASTWLNQARWNDLPVEVPRPPAEDVAAAEQARLAAIAEERERARREQAERTVSIKREEKHEVEEVACPDDEVFTDIDIPGFEEAYVDEQ